MVRRKKGSDQSTSSIGTKGKTVEEQSPAPSNGQELGGPATPELPRAKSTLPTESEVSSIDMVNDDPGKRLEHRFVLPQILQIPGISSPVCYTLFGNTCSEFTELLGNLQSETDVQYAPSEVVQEEEKLRKAREEVNKKELKVSIDIAPVCCSETPKHNAIMQFETIERYVLYLFMYCYVLFLSADTTLSEVVGSEKTDIAQASSCTCLNQPRY